MRRNLKKRKQLFEPVFEKRHFFRIFSEDVFCGILWNLCNSKKITFFRLFLQNRPFQKGHKNGLVFLAFLNVHSANEKMFGFGPFGANAFFVQNPQIRCQISTFGDRTLLWQNVHFWNVVFWSFLVIFGRFWGPERPFWPPQPGWHYPP